MKRYGLEMLAIAFIPGLVLIGGTLVVLVYVITWLWRSLK
jgi:hypothetical protein